MRKITHQPPTDVDGERWKRSRRTVGGMGDGNCRKTRVRGGPAQFSRPRRIPREMEGCIDSSALKDSPRFRCVLSINSMLIFVNTFPLAVYNGIPLFHAPLPATASQYKFPVVCDKTLAWTTNHKNQFFSKKRPKLWDFDFFSEMKEKVENALSLSFFVENGKCKISKKYSEQKQSQGFQNILNYLSHVLISCSMPVRLSGEEDFWGVINTFYNQRIQTSLFLAVQR